MKRNKILASVSTAALALGMLTVIGKKQVNAADNDDPANIVTVVNYTPTKSAVTAVKTSYNAKTKSLTITGKAKGASKVAWQEEQPSCPIQDHRRWPGNCNQLLKANITLESETPSVSFALFLLPFF
ncbi:hypothetical protein NYF20_03530 [Lactobacillus delbrueckii]|uniref:hypothetical protein n=1 Tax=Lactobacillus delbrueckii TaxID=1584 RepID=UPI0039C33FB3